MNEVLDILDHLKSAVVRDGQLVVHEFEAVYQKLRGELVHAFEHGPRQPAKVEPDETGTAVIPPPPQPKAE